MIAEPQLDESLPSNRRVTIFEMDDKEWGWQTERRGATKFPTPQSALEHYLNMEAQFPESNVQV